MGVRDIAVTIRIVMASELRTRRLLCTPGHDDVEPGRAARLPWSSRPSSRMSTSIPVNSRNGARLELSLSIRSSWSRSRSCGQPVRDPEPRRVVGQRGVLVSPPHCSAATISSIVPCPVGPVRVQVQVTAQGRPDPRTLLARCRDRFGLQVGESFGYATRE